jgi:hypothetical protein
MSGSQHRPTAAPYVMFGDEDGTTQLRARPGRHHRPVRRPGRRHWARDPLHAAITPPDRFKKFLNQIDQTVPADLEIHLISNNFSPHETPAIGTWLAAHARFQLHFTSTSTWGLNQVERCFGLLTDKQRASAQCGVHRPAGRRPR